MSQLTLDVPVSVSPLVVSWTVIGQIVWVYHIP